MLVLVSFVLVLAAAVTLVVGLLQSGLTLIYLSIACSVLAGVVLAVAVLRGRPEARPATTGRAFSPPQRAEVPAAVGASSATQTTTSWSAPPAQTTTAPPPPTPPPPAPTPSAAASDDAATKAAGTALLGRLRGRRAEEAAGTAAAASPAPATVVSTPEPEHTDTMAVPVVPADAGGDDDFPIADYDRLRATELLAQLPTLDRDQLETVRARESSGKNRFTIMSRIDSLLAAKAEPAWEAADDSWDDEAEAAPASTFAVSPDDEAALDADLANDTDGEWGADDEDVDELVSPATRSDFPIAGYEGLTVGQILPRLSELSGDELAEVRAREQQGRNRGTILDRVDRLSARAGARAGAAGGAMAMPPAAVPAAVPARKAPARKVVAPVSKTTAPPVKKARAPRAAKVVAEPEPVKASTRKAATRKAPAPAAVPAPTPRKTPTRKAAPVAPPPAPAAAKSAVKKARATKKST